jgi:hypothetical protein
MLYFSQETRKILLAGIHRVLAPDGILFLGSSEQPADPSIWTAMLAGGTCYFRPRGPGGESEAAGRQLCVPLTNPLHRYAAPGPEKRLPVSGLNQATGGA